MTGARTAQAGRIIRAQILAVLIVEASKSFPLARGHLGLGLAM